MGNIRFLASNKNKHNYESSKLHELEEKKRTSSSVSRV